MPQAGHLDKALSIFGYLKFHINSKLCFDPAHPVKNSIFWIVTGQVFPSTPVNKLQGTS